VSSHVEQIATCTRPDEELEYEEELELTDEQLKCADAGMPWLTGEPEPFENPITIDSALSGLPDTFGLSLSQFTEFAIKMPNTSTDKEGPTHVPFSFEGRRHMRRCYDTDARRILLFCGRQVEKSTLLGNLALGYSCLVPSFKTLYVSPTNTQTKTFSTDRLKEPVETSEDLKRFTTNMLSQNVFEKQFVNRSKITLRHAFLNADRTRGIPAYMLLIDELQDILTDNIPVIEQCTSHSPPQYRRFVYAGTPKSLDNTIETYRANYSTQGEWVIPCDAHGGETGRYWNILGEKNIGRKGLICEKCGKRINAVHPDARWAAMIAWDPVKVPFESYRICQLMVPWKPWDEILLDYRRYSRDRFYNEVLGISYDSGLRPLTRAHIQANCKEEIKISEADEKYRNLSFANPVYAGIDWGTGENTYTVLTLGMYVDMKFRIFYVYRFEGEDVDPVPQMEKITALCKGFNVRVIGTDYGGGFDRNDILMRKFGPQRVQKYQYMARAKKKVEWDGRLRRWKVHRTEVMSDIFNAIKRGTVFEFPRWDEFREPYGQDMLNIFSEYNKQLMMTVYKHSLDKPDDTLHSVLYCFLASMIMRPRPDVIAPRMEGKTVGALWSSYTGPTNQG
jgi:hypothetical protein